MSSAPGNANGPLPAGAIAALSAGNKIEAVKRVRAATGLGLEEAKALVERYAANPTALGAVGAIPADAADASPAPLPAAAVTALHAGRVIEAIKIVRTESDVGLKDAKTAVDRYLAEHSAVRARVDAILADTRRVWLNRLVALVLVGALAAYFLWS